MKYISVSNVSRQLHENFRNFSPMKFRMLSLCRQSEVDYGTAKSDYSALVLVKSILDYYRMSGDFSRSKATKLSMGKVLNHQKHWTKILPQNLYGRLKKDSEQETIR